LFVDQDRLAGLYPAPRIIQRLHKGPVVPIGAVVTRPEYLGRVAHNLRVDILDRQNGVYLNSQCLDPLSFSLSTRRDIKFRGKPLVQKTDKG